MKKTIAVLCSVFALLVITCSSPSGGDGPDPEDPGSGTPSFTTMIHKTMANDAQAYDAFGYSVAISGDYAIVGAYQEDGGGSASGAAYIFHRTSATTWDSGVKLMASDAQEFDRFGYSVAINGDYAIVGALYEDGGAGDPINTAGAAYVFHRNGTNTWDNGIKLVAPDAQAYDYFGCSVTISEDYAIVGAYQEDGGEGNPLSSAGAVYCFRRTGSNTWDNGVKLVAPDAQESDLFGTSVAISGDYAIVGAHGEDGGTGDPCNGTGAAYIFHRIGANIWDSGVKLVAEDANIMASFGYSVAISGSYAIVGAMIESENLGVEAGAAYVFHRTGTTSWDSGVKLESSDLQWNDMLGWSVAISGEYAIVGAPQEDGGMGNPLSNSGAAYIFHRTGSNTWDSGVKLMASDAQTSDYFGNSVAIDGNYAIVGAYTEDGGAGNPCSDAGAAYIFH